MADTEAIKNHIDTKLENIDPQEALEAYEELSSHCEIAADALREELEA